VVIKEFAPGPAFTPFLRKFEIIETAEHESVTRTLLPDTTIIIGFRYSGAATLLDGKSTGVLPDATVTGLRNSVRQMHTSTNGGIVLAKFRAAGASAFFGDPLHQLFGDGARAGRVDGWRGSGGDVASYRPRDTRLRAHRPARAVSRDAIS
jgi:hypothetical protein